MPEDTLALLHEHIQECLAERKDQLVTFQPSIFAAQAAAWAGLEERLGRPLPADLRRFYERCDGFTDNRYTRIEGVERFLASVRAALDAPGRSLRVATIGDGCGLDEKAIYLVLGDTFRGGEPMFVFHDYRMDFDEDAARGFRARVLDSSRAAFDKHFPLWMDGDGAPLDDGDEAELVHYGPVTMTELLDYVLDTATQI